jgi:adenosylcobinamide kinase / adenosylcobinamide-phosphate guanylyltransferase
MGKLRFIIGGARSGKSSVAVEQAGAVRQVAFIATAAPAEGDEEMKRRIAKHQEVRPAHWLTVEEPLAVANALADLDGKAEIVIIDCLTLLLTNWLLQAPAGIEEEAVLEKVGELARAVKKIKATVIIVSNEVGLGIHPATRLGRFFRDLAGWANCRLAAEADEVYLMTAGLPVKIKG